MRLHESDYPFCLFYHQARRWREFVGGSDDFRVQNVEVQVQVDVPSTLSQPLKSRIQPVLARLVLQGARLEQSNIGVIQPLLLCGFYLARSRYNYVSPAYRREPRNLSRHATPAVSYGNGEAHIVREAGVVVASGWLKSTCPSSQTKPRSSQPIPDIVPTALLQLPDSTSGKSSDFRQSLTSREISRSSSKDTDTSPERGSGVQEQGLLQRRPSSATPHSDHYRRGVLGRVPFGPLCVPSRRER